MAKGFRDVADLGYFELATAAGLWERLSSDQWLPTTGSTLGQAPGEGNKALESQNPNPSRAVAGGRGVTTENPKLDILNSPASKLTKPVLNPKP